MLSTLTPSQSAYLQVLIISLAPTSLLLLFPSSTPTSSSTLLKSMMSFSAGGLIGDVFLHSLPDSFASAKNPDAVGLAVIGEQLERSDSSTEKRTDSKNNIPRSYIANNLPLVASLLASPVMPTPFSIVSLLSWQPVSHYSSSSTF